MPHPAEPPIIRCPYCKLAGEFRPMILRLEGWFMCESCGHNAMPLDPGFHCTCKKCQGCGKVLLPDERDEP